MDYNDSFTDYDQLNYLVRSRIADALELKNKSKSKLYNEIIRLKTELEYYQRELQTSEHRLVTLKSKLAALKKTINMVK